MKSLIIAILISSLVVDAHAIVAGQSVKAPTGKGVDGAPPPVDGVEVDPHAGFPGGGFPGQRSVNPTGGIPFQLINFSEQNPYIASNLWQAVLRLNFAQDMRTVDVGFEQLLEGLNRTGLASKVINNGVLDANHLFQGLCLDAAQNPKLAEKFMQMTNQKRSSTEGDAREPNPLPKEPPSEWKKIVDPKTGKELIERVEIRNPKLSKMPATDSAKGKGSAMPATDTAKGKAPQTPSTGSWDRPSPPRVSFFASMADFLRPKPDVGPSPVRRGAAGSSGTGTGNGNGSGEGSPVDGDENLDFPPPLGEGCFNGNNGLNQPPNPDQRNPNEDQNDDEDDQDKGPGGEPDGPGKKKPFQPPQLGGAGGGKGGGGGNGGIPQFPGLGPLAELAVPPWISETCFVCPAIMAITNSMSASQFNSAQWAASLQASQDAFAATMSASIEAFGQSIAPFGAGAYRGVASTGQPLLGNSSVSSQRGGGLSSVNSKTSNVRKK